jgi:Na+-driven multidrug efflux pump
LVHPDNPTLAPKSAPRILKNILVGKARDPMDPRIIHHVTLVAFLASVGLGADGLSSSAYGPEEAFKALGEHAYLAVVLAVMIAATVLIISACYSKVIELFRAEEEAISSRRNFSVPVLASCPAAPSSSTTCSRCCSHGTPAPT